MRRLWERSGEGEWDMTDEEFVLWLRTMPNVSAALAHLRIMQHLTQQEVAELAGVSRAYVTHVERGERQPERDTLVALLLAAFSLPVPQANRLLLLAGYAPLHHLALARARFHVSLPMHDTQSELSAATEL
jgi:transcriptional regulator with XRE-family HTH domain